MILSRFRGMRALPFVAILLLAGCAERTDQPLAFDHKVHRDEGVDGSFCYEYIEKATYSGIPTTESCTACHEGDAEAPELQRLAQYVAAGEEIPFALHLADRVARVPRGAPVAATAPPGGVREKRLQRHLKWAKLTAEEMADLRACLQEITRAPNKNQ